MKKLILFCISFSLMIAVYGQKKQNIYFLKKDGKQVKLKDSADFIRIIEEADSGEKYFNIKEYYQNGTQKLIGRVSTFEPKITYEGQVNAYHCNGKKKSSMNYVKNQPIGMAYYFFENGKIKKQLEFFRDSLVKKEDQPELKVKSKLIYQVDSAGTVYVADGNGRLTDTTKFEKDMLIEEGDYKNGFKEGVWKGHYVSGKSSYIETYALGKFVNGTNTAGASAYEYTILEAPPKFKGGIDAFYRYLGNNIRYPSIAYTNRITGSVSVSFVIEKDGTVTDVKVNKPVMPAMDEEALRVIRASPKWIPGIQRGMPVKVKYNVPITFKMR